MKLLLIACVVAVAAAGNLRTFVAKDEKCKGRSGATKDDGVNWCKCNKDSELIKNEGDCKNTGGGRDQVCEWSEGKCVGDDDTAEYGDIDDPQGSCKKLRLKADEAVKERCLMKAGDHCLKTCRKYPKPDESKDQKKEEKVEKKVEKNIGAKAKKDIGAWTVANKDVGNKGTGGEPKKVPKTVVPPTNSGGPESVTKAEVRGARRHTDTPTT